MDALPNQAPVRCAAYYACDLIQAQLIRCLTRILLGMLHTCACHLKQETNGWLS